MGGEEAYCAIFDGLAGDELNATPEVLFGDGIDIGRGDVCFSLRAGALFLVFGEVACSASVGQELAEGGEE